VDFSRLDPVRVIVGGAASILLVVSLVAMPWYTLSHANVARDPHSGSYDPGAFICGVGNFSCTGFQTFPILRWLLLLAALSPVILAYILVRARRLSWPPGEMTMVAGFAAAILIIYNGIIDRPGSGIAESGVSLDYGYWAALVAAVAIAITGFLRSQVGQRGVRKAPGTV
jgi:hypothetical protein